MNVVKLWMDAATKGEQEQLAALAKTSRGHLYHLSNGRRVASSDLAMHIEAASTALVRDGLPALRREDMSPACGACEFAKRCREVSV